LQKAVVDEAMSGLIRSLRKQKIVSFAEWEKETKALLEKKIW
jgi:hypothetical protein